MNDALPLEPSPSSSLTSNALKYIAILAMLSDHLAAALVPSDSNLYMVMRMIGRITGPTMFFFAVEGYHHTRNLPRYLGRLFTFAVVSYLPFIYFTYGSLPDTSNWQHFNVIFTILLGIVGVYVRRNVENPVAKIALILLLLFLVYPADWGLTGFFMILTFDFFYGNFSHQMYGYLLIILFDVGVLTGISKLFSSIWYDAAPDFSYLTAPYNIVNMGHFLPMLLLSFYKGEQGERSALSKWFFYIFYPLHMVLIGLIYNTFFKGSL